MKLANSIMKMFLLNIVVRLMKLKRLLHDSGFWNLIFKKIEIGDIVECRNGFSGKVIEKKEVTGCLRVKWFNSDDFGFFSYVCAEDLKKVEK